MAGHAELKFVMTECSKTQIRLTGLIYIYAYHKLEYEKEDTYEEKDTVKRNPVWISYSSRQKVQNV